MLNNFIDECLGLQDAGVDHNRQAFNIAQALDEGDDVLVLHLGADQVIAQHISQLHDLLVADRFPLELGGQIGNPIRPAVFLMEPVNYLLHGVSRPDDLCLNFVAYRHHQKSS